MLLVQAYPNYEFRYLKNMLERDSTIQLKTVLQDADLEYAELDQTALARLSGAARGAVRIRRRDLRRRESVVSERQRAGESARLRGAEGGRRGVHCRAAVHAAGLSQHAAGAAVSDRPERCRRAPARRGARARALSCSRPTWAWRARRCNWATARPRPTRIWQDLPPLYWLLEAPHVKPAARVLAEHPTRLADDGRQLPVFMMQYVGAGKVLFHATDDTWRWRYRVGDVFFARYWVQAVRYLSRSKLLGKDHSVELSADRREYPPRRAGAVAGALHRRAAGAGGRRWRDGGARARGAKESARQACSATPPVAACSKAP